MPRLMKKASVPPLGIFSCTVLMCNSFKINGVKRLAANMPTNYVAVSLCREQVVSGNSYPWSQFVLGVSYPDIIYLSC